jgi:formylglycine-generating enzyme required for sulfatase activity
VRACVGVVEQAGLPRAGRAGYGGCKDESASKAVWHPAMVRAGRRVEIARRVWRMMPRVPRDAFISHASVDAQLALAICEGLEGRGLTCWIAPRDVGSEGTYGTEIIKGLRDCETFLIVLTQSSSASQQVEREAERASFYQKRIIPLAVGQSEPGERLEFYTAGRQRVACAATIDDTFLDRLTQVIRGGAPAAGPARVRGASPLRAKRTALLAALALVAAAFAVWGGITFLKREAPAAAPPDNPTASKPLPEARPPASQPSSPPPVQNQAPSVVRQPPAGRGSGPRAGAQAAETTPAITPDVDSRPAPRAPSELVVNGARLTFASIPAGSFTMGCSPGDSDCTEDEKATKRIQLDGFQMGATEVTQALWTAAMGSNPSDFEGPNLPVENVSWRDAAAFVSKLNQRGDGFTYRLPREDEWEYAARAKGEAPVSLASVGWFGLLSSAGSAAGTREVGKRRPNAWGLYDMLGNVAEWCEDWYSPQYQRVVRGGAWTDGALSLRFSARGKAMETTRTYSIGVRLVRTAAPRTP